MCTPPVLILQPGMHAASLLCMDHELSPYTGIYIHIHIYIYSIFSPELFFGFPMIWRDGRTDWWAFDGPEFRLEH